MIVSAEEFDDFLGGPMPAESVVRSQILADVENTFLRETGRGDVPFVGAQTDRQEIRTGTGLCKIWLDYPIDTVSSIKLGFDPSAPNEILSPSDKRVVVYLPGSRHITRIDGGLFGLYQWPGYVHVTYNAQADLPLDVRLAILRRSAAIYWRRGSEDASSEAAAGFSTVFGSTSQGGDPVWAEAVARHTRAPV